MQSCAVKMTAPQSLDKRVGAIDILDKRILFVQKNTLVKRACLWQPENSFFWLYSQVDCCQALVKRVGFWHPLFFFKKLAMPKMAKAKMMTFLVKRKTGCKTVKGKQELVKVKTGFLGSQP